MNEVKFAIGRSRTGLPTLGVGGGAYRNTAQCRYVLRDGQLAPALVVFRHGQLSNSLSQALVVIKEGDEVVELYGGRHDSPEAFEVRVHKVQRIDGDYAFAIPVNERPQIPPSVLEGMSLYHNRDGGYFVAPIPSR